MWLLKFKTKYPQFAISLRKPGIHKRETNLLKKVNGTEHLYTVSPWKETVWWPTSALVCQGKENSGTYFSFVFINSARLSKEICFSVKILKYTIYVTLSKWWLPVLCTVEICMLDTWTVVLVLHSPNFFRKKFETSWFRMLCIGVTDWIFRACSCLPVKS